VKDWTPQAITKLGVLYPHHPTWAVAELLNRSIASVKSKAGVLNLRKPGRQVWTAEELDLLRKLYADHSSAEIAQRVGRSVGKVYQAAARLGLQKSAKYMAHNVGFVLQPGIGAAYRFPKGHAPANKGLRRPGYAPGRMAQTQFKKGQRAGAAEKLWKPVGTIVADPEGYLRIKVRERVNGQPPGWSKEIWPLLHWRVYEQHKGPIPKGHKVVFRDRNRSHCEIENLELITDGEMMRRNSIHNLPPELKQVIVLNGALKRRLRRLCGKEQTERLERPLI
jgi:hypothetical protein